MKLELDLEDSAWLIHFLRDLAEWKGSAAAYSRDELARLQVLIDRTEAARTAALKADKDPQVGKVLRLVKP